MIEVLTTIRTIRVLVITMFNCLTTHEFASVLPSSAVIKDDVRCGTHRTFGQTIITISSMLECVLFLLNLQVTQHTYTYLETLYLYC